MRVYGTLRGEETPREVIGTVAAWKTNNKQWETQVDQMLSYRGAREWARRHMPEVILGVYAEEELEQIASRPTTTTVSVDTLEDFVTPTSVEATDDHKGKVYTTPEYAVEAKPVEAEVVKPQPKTATVIDAEEARKAEKAKKTSKDKTIDDLFG